MDFTNHEPHCAHIHSCSMGWCTICTKFSTLALRLISEIYFKWRLWQFECSYLNFHVVKDSEAKAVFFGSEFNSPMITSPFMPFFKGGLWLASVSNIGSKSSSKSHSRDNYWTGKKSTVWEENQLAHRTIILNMNMLWRHGLGKGDGFEHWITQLPSKTFCLAARSSWFRSFERVRNSVISFLRWVRVNTSIMPFNPCCSIRYHIPDWERRRLFIF